MRRSRNRFSKRAEINKTQMQSYNSVSELYDYIKNTSRHSAWDGDSVFDHDENYLKRWCGETPEVAMEKLHNGDADAAAKIKAEGEILNEAQGGTMPKIEVGVYGCIPSVPNYLRGVPTNMMRVVREPRRNPVIDIFVENSIQDGIDTKAVARKAAVIANVITATEMAGVRVNLYSVNTAHDQFGGRNGTAYSVVVKIKDAASPLNLLNVAFCVCNRAMHRSVFLAWLERQSETRIECYGRPMRGNEIQPTFGLDGVVLSIRDMVENDEGIDDVTRKINEYLKNK